MTEDEQFEKIMAGIAAAQAQGLAVQVGAWGVRAQYDDGADDPCLGTIVPMLDYCCPMGALILGQPMTVEQILPHVAGALLETSYGWVMTFAQVFDNGAGGLHYDTPDRTAGARMGLRVRRALGIGP